MEAEKAKHIAAAERYVQKGSLRRAIAAYRKVLRVDPQDLRAQLKLGDLYARSGEVAAAVPIFRAVAEHYASQGQFLKATAVYKRLVELEPTNADLQLRLAECYQSQGLRNDAADHFRAAIERYSRLGDTPNTLSTVKRLLALDPMNVVGRIRLAEAYSKGGWIEDAAETYRGVCQILKRQGRRDDYARVAERLLYHDPDDFEVAKELAAWYVEQDFPQKALPKLHRCYRLRSRDIDVLELLALAFDQLNQSHKAVVMLKALAAIYQESGLRREYRDTMARVLEIDPDDIDARAVFELVPSKAAVVSGAREQSQKEIVFEPPDDGGAANMPPEEEEDESGFEEHDAPAPSAGAAPPAARPNLAPPALPPQELSLTGVTLEDITSQMGSDLVTSIPVVEAEVDDREDLPFELDEPLRVVVPRRSNSGLGVPPSDVPPSDAPPASFLPSPVPTEPTPPSSPIDLSDEWFDEDDRTLVDHQLDEDEVQLVDAHLRAAELDLQLQALPGRGPAPAPPVGDSSEEDPFNIELDFADALGVGHTLPDIAASLSQLDALRGEGEVDAAEALLADLCRAHPDHPEVVARASQQKEGSGLRRKSKPAQ